MSALPDLPPRQRPAAGAVLSTLGSYPEGPVTAPRRELLERSGLSWTSWRETLARLGPYRLVVTEKGSKDGREASYTLTPEGRAAAQELDAHPGKWAPEARRPPDAHPTPRASRARSSLRIPLKTARNEEAAPEQATPGAHPDAHPGAGLTEEDRIRIGQETARELLRLALALLGQRDVQDRAHGDNGQEKARNAEEPPANPSEGTERAHGVHLDPEALASALNRPGHDQVRHVAQVLVEEQVKTEDDALAFGRHVLDSSTIHSPGAFVRLLVRGAKTLSEKERSAALLAKEPPQPVVRLSDYAKARLSVVGELLKTAKALGKTERAAELDAEAARLRSEAALAAISPPTLSSRSLSELDRMRLSALETRAANARRRGHDQAAEELEAEAKALRSGAA